MRPRSDDTTLTLTCQQICGCQTWVMTLGTCQAQGLAFSYLICHTSPLLRSFCSILLKTDNMKYFFGFFFSFFIEVNRDPQKDADLYAGNFHCCVIMVMCDMLNMRKLVLGPGRKAAVQKVPISFFFSLCASIRPLTFITDSM